jgi:hypothetical protein
LDLVTQKKAHLAALFANVGGPVPEEAPDAEGDDDDEEEEEEHGAEEEEEDDVAEVADGVDPLNPSESKDDLVFDLHPSLPEQLAEYKFVEGQFKKNKLAYDDRMLKEAVIYDNTLPEAHEKVMVT